LILVVDNFDSFTYNLVDYFEQLGQQVVVQRNNAPLSDLLSEAYRGIVLSPGPGIPSEAGSLMNIIDYYSTRIPMLGICLGHQALAEYFGGQLTKAIRPMHGKISEITHQDESVFVNLPLKFKVVRYHSLIVQNLPDVLVVLANDDDKQVMALQHVQLPIAGLQFHPEALLTEFGLDILRNWVKLMLATD
jgi:anthranilate synthase component 2